MLRNGKDITETQDKKKVCIIGTGPAGIVAANELSKKGVSVILLEGSRQLNYTDPEYRFKSFQDKEILYDGISDGLFTNNEPDFLIRPFPGSSGASERERVFGGTSTHWGGQSRPLDPITFEKRNGFPGWPITRETLDPYYAKAVGLNHLFGDYFGDDGEAGKNFSAEFWVEELEKQGVQAAIPELKNFNAEMYQFMGSKWCNFAIRCFGARPIAYDPNVDLIVNATLLDIVEQNGHVSHLNVASMNDDRDNPQMATTFQVKADIYILALGAVANARQLLLSEVGNKHKQVGHYFMCHPLSQGSIISTKEQYLMSPERNLMGCGESKWKDPDGNVDGIEGRFTLNAKTAKDEGIGRCWFWANKQYGSNQMYFEMAPNYNSFIGLDKDGIDPIFKQSLTHARWEFSELDQRTYTRNCELFNGSSSKYQEIITWPKWEDFEQYPGSWEVNGHHIGTTRMSASTEPEKGVVDEDLKIHGVDNMYVAGSSVFPSAGVSNPTMTIIALSIRLGEHVYNLISGNIDPDGPTWYGKIKGYFTEGDIKCMRSAMGWDLGDYETVKENAAQIYGSVKEGRMPPSQKWSDKMVDTFWRWMKDMCPKGTP